MPDPIKITAKRDTELRDHAIRALKAAGVLEEREGQEENAKSVEWLARWALGRGDSDA